jgi:hypothetical protein
MEMIKIIAQNGLFLAGIHSKIEFLLQGVFTGYYKIE